MRPLTRLFPELYRLALAEQRAVFGGCNLRRRSDGTVPHPGSADLWCEEVYDCATDPVQVRFLSRLLRRTWLHAGGSKEALGCSRSERCVASFRGPDGRPVEVLHEEEVRT